MSVIDYLEFDNAQQNFLAGLGWGENPQAGSGFFTTNHDLDLCCCLMTKNFDLVDFISPLDPKMQEYRFEVLHTGDHKTGNSPGEDEELRFNLRKLNPDVFYAVFLVKVKGGVSFQDVKNPYCSFMDGGSYRRFLSLDVKLGKNSGIVDQGFEVQYVAAVLKRWAGKTLDGDLWTLLPIEEFIPCSGEAEIKDFWDIKAMVEEFYRA